MNQKDYYSKKLTTSRLMVLHLAPGALIVALYIFISPIVKAFGYPSIMSLMIAFLMVILPLELGFLMNI